MYNKGPYWNTWSWEWNAVVDYRDHVIESLNAGIRKKRKKAG